ncbi:MAG: Translation initiation factor IF-2 [Candidatus Omnitrophica bacterium]|nr:Translation initiation factor IF-2 [Candidatus Omnitrophota bacterium]
MSLRVHELAKELKLSSKDLMDKLKSQGVDVKSHMSVLTDEQVSRLKGTASKPTPAPKAAAAAKETASSARSSVTEAPKAEAPKADPVKASQPKTPAPAAGLQGVRAELSAQRASAPVKPVSPAAPPRPAAPSQPKSAPIVKPAAPVVARPAAAPPPVKPVTAAPVEKPIEKVETRAPRKLEIGTTIIVKDLADKVQVKPSDLIGRLIRMGVFANINQSINHDMASKIAVELGYEVEAAAAEVSAASDKPATKSGKGVVRAPIVTFMGHVDHGKTSLLDAIRKTKVAASEAGGITQHIGAYEVFLPNGAVTFLDTPGHEAFTAMRARGARATDVVVLVVAADDGVMPQTEEAIDHAKAAGVPIIVAINKTDLPSANPDKVKKELMEHGLMPEEWGGKTIMVGVSAKTGKGIDELLEMLVLESELLELRADPEAAASGTVVEAELSKGSGVLATVLVQDGTLRVGDVAIVGDGYCKIRAMINDRGQRVKEAPPSMPVEILGLSEMPKAGDRFYVVKDERAAKEIVEKRREELRLKGSSHAPHVHLEHLLEDVKAGKIEELKLIIKSDVQGSVEALRATLSKVPSKNVRLNIIHTGIGDITETDVMLAAASEAVVIGFHVGISSNARETAEREGVDVRFYEIIYEAKTAIEQAMEGLLAPELKETFVGAAEVRQVFKVSKHGTIAGCAVVKGKIIRNAACRVLRAGKKVHEGKVISLKRFKDDAREVLEGFECGIGVSGFDDILTGDRIEVFEVQQLARKLE